MTRQDLMGVTLIVCVLAFLGSMAVLARSLREPHPYDPDTLCPVDRAVPHTLLLVDRTDPFSDEHRRLFMSAVERAAAALGEDERFSIFLIEGTAPVTPTPVFSICKPSDGSKANWLYENKCWL